MTFLERLERTFGGFAIPGLMRYVTMLNAGVFLLILMKQPIVAAFMLEPELVMQGQVWRLFTWIFIPTTGSLLWIFFYLMFLWWMGDMLEATWGTFRLNLYYLTGMVGCTLSAFFFGASYGNLALNTSLLLAMATMAPDLEILFLFFPLKLRWVALISLVFPFGVNFVLGGIAGQLTTVACLLNYAIFFGPTILRQMRDQKNAQARRAKFEASVREGDSSTMHSCAVCQRTEITAPDLDFRVAADGQEYCTDHLPK